MQVLLAVHFLVAMLAIRTANALNEALVTSWSDKIASNFKSFLDETMLVPQLQEIYDKTPVTKVEKAGRVEAAATAAQIGALLNDLDGTLRDGE
jgi:hypothetical protein